MPGCGKTTVAKQISKATGKKLIDIDAEIEKKNRPDRPDIINNDGEPYFRELETAEIMLAGKESGKVIATGGGAVTPRKTISRCGKTAAYITSHAISGCLSRRPSSFEEHRGAS
jgi:shikimate kinase